MGDVAAFDEEMQHELLGADRPGIRSRISHDLAAFQNTRIQLGVGAHHCAAASWPPASCTMAPRLCHNQAWVFRSSCPSGRQEGVY